MSEITLESVLSEFKDNQVTEEEKSAVKLLLSINQKHIFERWRQNQNITSEQKRALLQQTIKLDKQYANGGLKQYYLNGVRLIKDSFNSVNVYQDYTPSVPSGITLEFNSDAFHEYERIGVENFAKLGFVLVAGGLGERLGYSGIKIELPTEIVTNVSYIEYYIKVILAMQAVCKAKLPFAIMTSGQTHAKTVDLLEHNSYFGMDKSQITIMKQELVASFANNDCQFALENDFSILQKPHGHGDVHSLMYSTGTAKKWLQNGTKYILFFQDTNALAMHAIPCSLGVSVKHNYAMNSITVPRKPGQALGGVAKLTNNKTAKSLTINVEYNQLGPMLLSTGTKEGDVADHKNNGNSLYPGNINTFVLDAQIYNKVMQDCKGLIPEFVNPKYTDASKKKFKKPTRLECMMQEYPKLLERYNEESECGITSLPRWFTSQPVKSNIEDSIAQCKSMGTSFSAAHGEEALYFFNRHVLNSFEGVDIKEEQDEKSVFYAGVEIKNHGAKIVLDPSFGVSVKQIRERFAKECDVKVSCDSVVVFEGDVVVQGKLWVKGSLLVKAKNGSKVVIKNLVVENKGISFKEVDVKDESVEEIYRIRGYVLDVREKKVIQFDDGKTHIIE